MYRRMHFYAILLAVALLLLFSKAQEQRRRHRRYGKHGPSKRSPSAIVDQNTAALAPTDNCDTKFVKYQSSPYESKWLSEINVRELNCCLYLMREASEQTLMYQVTQEAHDSHYTNMTKENLFRVFSMFIYQRTCPNPADNMVRLPRTPSI